MSHGEKESVRSVSQKAGPKWKLPLTWASTEAIFRTQKAGNAKSSLLMLQVVAKGLETTTEKLLKGLYHRLGNATKCRSVAFQQALALICQELIPMNIKDQLR